MQRSVGKTSHKPATAARLGRKTYVLIKCAPRPPPPPALLLQLTQQLVDAAVLSTRPEARCVQQICACTQLLPCRVAEWFSPAAPPCFCVRQTSAWAFISTGSLYSPVSNTKLVSNLLLQGASRAGLGAPQSGPAGCRHCRAPGGGRRPHRSRCALRCRGEGVDGGRRCVLVNMVKLLARGVALPAMVFAELAC